MDLNKWGAIASIASFFQGFWLKLCGKSTLNIGKSNVGGNRIDRVGGDAQVDSTENPSSTNIGGGNVGGDKIGEVQGNLRITKSSEEAKDVAKDIVNIGQDNVGHDYIGEVGGNLTIGDSTNIAQQFNAGTIYFNTISDSQASLSEEAKQDLATLGKAFSILCKDVSRYAPEMPQMSTLKDNLINSFSSFQNTLDSVSYNIPTPIYRAIKEYVFYAHLLKGLVDHINSIAPIAHNPGTSAEDIRLGITYHEEYDKYLKNRGILEQRSGEIQTAIKKARGIDQ